jgi:hypothetical protein
MVPSIAILALVALAALIFTNRRNASGESTIERAAASRALVLATAAQSIHFVEEWMTGFHIQFPALFGQDPMPLPFFVAFNLAWIAIWIVSVPLVRSGVKPAVFAAWFLALAGMLNGIAHPLLAVLAGSYFPGLISSPIIGVASLYLWRRLHRAFLTDTR